MSVVAGRPTEVRNAATATLSDLDRELREHETARQAAAAVAWLDATFQSIYAGGVLGVDHTDRDWYRTRISAGSNYHRYMAEVLDVPGVAHHGPFGENVYSDEPSEDGVQWRASGNYGNLDEFDDFLDGQTPRERRDAERARLLALRPAPVRHVELTGRGADFTIVDDPLGFREVRPVRRPPGGRSNHVDPLADLRRALEVGDEGDVMIEVRDDFATGGRVWRLTIDHGRTWRTLPRDQAQTAWRLLEAAAQRSNRARFPMPPPAPPPARLSWSFDDVRPDPAMESIGAQLMAHTRAVAEAADLEEAIVRLHAVAGPSLRGFEVEHLRRRLMALLPEARRRVVATLLEQYLLPGRRVNWSTIVDDILGSIPHRPGSRLDRHPPQHPYDRCEPVPPRIDFTYVRTDDDGTIRGVDADGRTVAISIDHTARPDDEEIPW